MFGVNSSDGIHWDVQYPNKIKGFITRLILDNVDGHNGVKGIFCAGQYNIENITAFGMSQTIKFTSQYLDSRYLSRITTDRCVGDEYQFDLTGLGDAVILEGLTGTSNKILKIYACNGASIRSSIIHGEIMIQDSSAINISSCHHEEETIYIIKNSQITIENCFIWKRDGVTPINIKNENNFSKPMVLQNIKFIYPISKTKNNYDDVEIEMDGYAPITIKNVTKSYEFKSEVASSYEFGITTNIESFNKNKARNSIYSIIVPKKGVVDTLNVIDNKFGNWDKYFLDKVEAVSLSNNINNLSWDKEFKTYYYKSLLITDADRQLGTTSDDTEKTVTVDTGKIVRITNQSTSKTFLIHNTLRIYRGTESGVYTEYVDLPICSFADVLKYDLGSTISKIFQWKRNESNALQKLNKCYKYTFNGHNVTVYCDSFPTIGKWYRNDTVYINKPVPGGYIGYVCIEGDGSNLGTWKGFGKIEE